MQNLIGQVIEFTPKIKDMEAYPEGGMRARIVKTREEDTHSKDLHDHVYIITFDYSEFDDFNKRFEKANYYDRNMIPRLTAREANMYQVEERIYFGSPELWPFEDHFTLLDADRKELTELFNQQTEETNYVRWLEAMVLKANDQ